MKRYALSATLALLLVAHSVNASDWRNKASPNEKLNNLVEVMPGASVIMLQMGERFRNLYWAAKQNKWEFAEYQTEEMQDLIETLMITRPKRKKTAQKFFQTAFKQFPDAFKKRDWSSFANSFENMRKQCMICHVDNDHAFIVLPKHPRKGNSPILE